MTMKVYTRKEILLNKHFDTEDERYKIITGKYFRVNIAWYSFFSSLDALVKGFALDEEAMVALRASLKQARTQLTKDVRYLKVMKPSPNEDAANENGNAMEDDESTQGDTQIQSSDEE